MIDHAVARRLTVVALGVGLLASCAERTRACRPAHAAAVDRTVQEAMKPGTNRNALEKATGKRMSDLLQETVLGPLGLTNTTDPGPGAPSIPEPALHAFTSERRSQLGIPAATRFYEESTYRNPSWTITRGAIQTTNIVDMNATAVAVRTGTLLS